MAKPFQKRVPKSDTIEIALPTLPAPESPEYAWIVESVLPALLPHGVLVFESGDRYDAVLSGPLD